MVAIATERDNQLVRAERHADYVAKFKNAVNRGLAEWVTPDTRVRFCGTGEIMSSPYAAPMDEMVMDIYMLEGPLAASDTTFIQYGVVAPGAPARCRRGRQSDISDRAMQGKFPPLDPTKIDAWERRMALADCRRVTDKLLAEGRAQSVLNSTSL